MAAEVGHRRGLRGGYQGPGPPGLRRGARAPVAAGHTGGPAMIDAGDLRNGSVFEREGQLFVTVGFSHMKMGRGTAQVRAKIRNLKTGATMDETFRPEQRFPLVRIERRKMQYLYADSGQY